MGNGEAALRDYDKAIQMDPTKSIFYINKSEFLISQAPNIESVASTMANKAEAAKTKSQAKQYLENAKQTLNKALEINSKDVEALKLLRRIANKEDNQAEVSRIAKLIKELEK